ncbi:MAG: peptidylprolyl isomerase [Sumerlaeia bacterium]
MNEKQNTLYTTKSFYKFTATTAFALLAVCGALNPSTVPAQSPQPTENLELNAKAFSSVEIASNQDLFTAFGETFTAGEYTNMIRYFPPSPFGRINSIDFSLNDYSATIIRNAIHDYAIQREAYNRAVLLNLELTESEQNALTSQKERMLQLVWLEEKGILAPMEITEAEILAEYDKIKDDQLVVEELLELRHIFFSSYEEYTVEEGDSLESIAEKISGNAAESVKILGYELPRSPRGEATTDEEGNEVPPKALTIGEKLLVPMNLEKRDEISLNAQEAYSKLSQGENFEDIAKEFGDNNSKGVPVKLMPEKADRPLLPEFVEAFHSVEDGDFTEPFKTKHGFQILQRVSYTPKGYKPLNEVRAEIQTRVETIRRNDLYQKLIADLWAEYDEIEINEDALMNGEKPEYENEILFRIDDFNFPGSMLKRDFGNKLTPGMTFAERRALLAAVPSVSRAVTKWDIQRNNLTESEIYQERRELVDASIMFTTYQRYYMNELHPFDPSEEEYQAKYDELAAQFANLPVAEVWQISVAPPEGTDDSTQAGVDAINALRTELEAKLKEYDVKDVESFENLARIYSEDAYAETGGKLGAINQFYQNGFGAQMVGKQRENSLYGPFYRDGSVVVFWIGEIKTVNTPLLDDVRPGLKKELERDYNQKILVQMKDELLEASNLKLLPPLGSAEL